MGLKEIDKMKYYDYAMWPTQRMTSIEEGAMIGRVVEANINWRKWYITHNMTETEKDAFDVSICHVWWQNYRK